MCQKRYRGESGFNAHARLDTHEKQIRGSVKANSMARHLTEKHPARRRDPITFSFRVEKAGERPLPRQIRKDQGPDPGSRWTMRLCGGRRGDNYSGAVGGLTTFSSIPHNNLE